MRRFLIVFFLSTFVSICLGQAQTDTYDYALSLYRLGIYEKAFDKFSELSLHHRDIQSQYYVAECYANGYGVEKDEKKAFFQFRRLAEKGLPVAQAKAAYCLYKGVGTPIDKAKANYWMEKALFYPSVDGYTLYVLGLCYEEGLGRDQDVNKAMDLYSQALSKGVDDAFVHLSKLLASGGIIQKNYTEAIRIIDKGINNIGSAVDYSCKGQILLDNKDMANNDINWKLLQSKFPYYAVNSKDAYCILMRRISPITEDILLEAFSQNEPSASNSPLLANNVDEKSLSKNNTIVIKYEIAQEPLSPVNQSSTPESPLFASPIEENNQSFKLSDVDQDIPSINQNNENTFALIIANENYQDVAKVPNALNDGEIFAEYCKKTLGLPSSNVVLVKDATYNNIKREINKLSQIANAYNGSAKIVFYYAGHGVPNEATKDAFLLPVDGYGTDTSTGYSLKELYAILGQLPAEQVVVLLDACFSGSQRGEGMLASARGVAIKAKPNKVDGKMVILSAAQGDETAYPYEEQRHGLFTYYLLKKIQETNGNVSLGDLAAYIKDNVSKKSIVVNGKPQTPSVSPSAILGETWKNWKLY